MIEEIDASRRGFFQILGAAVTVGGLMTPAIAQESRETAKKGKVKATPPEDLMREHGVLDRVAARPKVQEAMKAEGLIK